MGAINGTLVFMVGCQNEQEFEKSKGVLEGMGKKFFNCGGPGTGEIAKIANNYMIGIHMVATSEGLALA